MPLWCELQCAGLVSRPCQHFLGRLHAREVLRLQPRTVIVAIISLFQSLK